MILFITKRLFRYLQQVSLDTHWCMIYHGFLLCTDAAGAYVYFIRKSQYISTILVLIWINMD